MSQRDLIEQLEAAKAKMLEMQKFINQVSAPPLKIGCVLHVDKQTGEMIASGSEGTNVLNLPQFQVKIGDFVALHAESMQAIKLIDYFAVGPEGSVNRKFDDGKLEIGLEHSSRICLASDSLGEVEPGDKVLLDESRTIALAKLPEPVRAYSRKATSVTWDDVGGQEEAKTLLREAIEYPYLYSKIYSHYGKKPPKGILLWGPPGCGKTMLGKAAATSIASLHKANADDAFMYVKTPELLNPYVGATEAEIRNIFQRAREHHGKFGYPAVVFFDEADAIMNKRGSGISSDVDRSIIPTFLTEMDGLDDSTAIIVLATNRADTLDEAIIRDGRVDYKIEIARPDKLACQEIYSLNLSKVPLANSECPKSLAHKVTDFMFTEQGLENMRVQVSGAMVANVVQRSTSIALRRDVAANRKSGVKYDDLTVALSAICQEAETLPKATKNQSLWNR